MKAFPSKSLSDNRKPVLSHAEGSAIQNRKWTGLSVFAFVLVVAVGMAEAQQATKVPRIGFLTLGAFINFNRHEAFRQGMRELGYIEGSNIAIEYRHGEGKLDRLNELAAELVRLKIDVIVTGGPAPTRAAKAATTTIPIVMTQDPDPVGNGFVASLARPGGNITGIASPEYAVVYKLLELLKEIAPNVQRAALVSNPENTSTVFYRRHFEAAAPALGVQPVIMPVQRPADIERAFETFAQQPHGGLVFPSDLTLLAHRQMVTALALEPFRKEIESAESVMIPCAAP
jgi:putative tryptophan/tyrosine transport system substrate-binding protein